MTPPAARPDPGAAPTPAPTVGGEVTSAVQLLASLLGLGGYVYLIGGVVSWVHFGAARLPNDQATATLTSTQLFETGFRSLLFMALVFSLMCLVAWLAAGWRWSVNAGDWHDVISHGGVAPARAAVVEGDREAWKAHREHALHALRARRIGVVADAARHVPRMKSLADAVDGERERHLAAAQGRSRLAARRPEPIPANLGPAAVRVLAGFNIVVISAALGLLAAQIVQGLFGGVWWLIVAVGLVVYLVVHLALTKWGPLQWPPWAHGLAWLAVVVVAVFITAPLGLLLAAGFAVSLLGRPLGRIQRPTSLAQLLRSPLVWALFTFYALVALAFAATPPVAFTRVVITTGSSRRVGAFLSRGDGGVYLATCTPLADGTSTNERVIFAPDDPSTRIALGGQLRLDSGQRPSLAAFAMQALGIGAHPPTWFKADLRARRAACVGGAPEALSTGVALPALGAGVIAGPAPNGAAHDGELPIGLTTPPAIAELAREYKPTLLVTVADRFWPVSVGAVLQDVNPSTGQRTVLCHLPPTGAITCAPATSLGSLSPAGSSASDYLRYPADLRDGPAAQFAAFETGQSIDVGSLHHWLAHPDVLAPWYTAQIYFYYAGPIPAGAWPARPPDPNVASGLIGLEYWFFYPFNYYPLVVDSALMEDAPLGGEKANVDLHQGDWEHIVVLLDPKTLKPLWLYTARHADEGHFYPWGTPTISLDGTHPVIQAAFGGHPSYPAYCQARPRVRVRNLSSDWLVCGSGRFAFRATTTPLVDLAQTSWACWKGHFGEAKPGLEVNAPGETDDPLTTARKFVYVAGPASPLWQAENGSLSTGTGPCSQPGGPASAERAAEADVAKRLPAPFR
jgi:hypothetical protein